MEKKNILVVEDERAIAKAMELKLKRSDFEVRVASNGDEALEILGRENFDLIVLDLIMPKRDGFSTLQEINLRKIKIPVIVSSNLSQEEDFKKAKDLGAVDFFVKSNTPITELVEKIRNFLQ